MLVTKFMYTSILTLHILTVQGQVPVSVEPKPFQFDVYPDKVVKFNTGQVNNPSASIMATYNIPPAGASSEEQRRYAEKDIRRYDMQIAQKQKLIDDANGALEAVHIDYEFPFSDLPEKNLYFDAFNYLKKVLNGDEPINLEAAVFFVEHAYNPSLNYNEFSKLLGNGANVIGLKMQQDKISPDDNIGKIMTTFRFLSDTLKVYSKSTETTITTYPKTYDFEDFWGRKDYNKMFVSKLMKEGSGQCHSLPLYFLLLCERINADASLAFAPNHSFIKFKDKRGNWHNLELTNAMLTSDHFMVESGYIKAEAIQNRIYLEALTKKQTIVQCLNDLASGYIKKYGYDSFVKACTELAIENDMNSLSAHQINANYYMMLDSYIKYQYEKKGISKEAYQQDEKAKSISDSATGANKFIERLGYTDMPQDVYEAWLKSAQTEANKQQHKKEVKVLGGMIEIK
ncbi:MAG TPA: hypothetical protein VFU05_12445 [Cyclobacteriaceae bacterium]|nr:hypothetical protein [Cyclobacteriaceae bacterium]